MVSSRLFRMTTSIGAGVAGVALPLDVSLKPTSWFAGSLTVETAILASTGMYWLFVRGAHRLRAVQVPAELGDPGPTS